MGLQTPPGPEGSNGKQPPVGAVGAPDRSWLTFVRRYDEFDERCTTVLLSDPFLRTGQTEKPRTQFSLYPPSAAWVCAS